MRWNRNPIIWFSFLSFLFCLNQQSFSYQEKAHDELQEKVTVTLKLIQVYVTDKDGNPVRDLNKEDFFLYDNGELQTITDFESHFLYQQPDRVDELSEPEKISTPGPNESRKFLLFFDFVFNNRFGIDNAKKAAIYFIDTQLIPSDEVGIISFTTTNYLTALLDFTADHKKVREIVENINPTKAFRGHKLSKDSYWCLSRTPHPFVTLSRLRYKYYVTKLSSHIKDLSHSLSSLPGNKHIIFFSSGVVSSVMYDTRSGSIDNSQEKHTLQVEYENMIKELSASGSFVFSLDSGELGSVIPQSKAIQGRYSLNRLTMGTGGKYYDNLENYNDIMNDVHTFTSFYYVLGFHIDEKWEGEYHEIKVSVKYEGYQVHAQSGYYDPKSSSSPEIRDDK